MTSYSDSKDEQKYPRQSSPSKDDTLSQLQIDIHSETGENVAELEGSILPDGQQQDLPNSISDHVLPRVETDGRKSKKRPRPSSPEPGERLGTARHDEVDVLTSRSPTNGRGISDVRSFGTQLHNQATTVIAGVGFGKCAATSKGPSTLGKEGEVRLDDQGSVWDSNGKRFVNLQVQYRGSTVAASLVEAEREFGPKRIRRALNQSLETQKVNKLSRDSKT